MSILNRTNFRMAIPKLFLIFTFISLMIGQSFANQNDYQLQYNVDDLTLKYGEYSEVEFYINSSDAVDFEITSEMKPVGLQLYPLENNSVLLSGLPEFIDKFCFLMTIKSSHMSSDKQTTERVCLIAEENENLNHPKFETQRHLSLRKNSFKSISISLDRQYSHITPSFVQGELPEGIQSSEARGQLKISGSTNYDGVFEFLVMALDQKDGREEFYVYKQYQVEVKPEIVNRYQCAEGYYYDETLGYCVQNAGDYCPQGTFYDPQSNICVRYTTPTHVRCTPGSYYDHFLYRCVRNTYQRCPYNYEFDPYYNKCVRLPNTCSIGYRYDYSYRSCIYVGHNQCQRGTHYSSYRNRCVSNYAYCRAGSYWDGYTCRYNTRSCGRGYHWEPYSRSCRRSSVYSSCRSGYNWNNGRNRCVRRSVYANRTCRGGLRYSPRAGRCVTYRPTNTRPHRRGPVVRPHHRRPVVVRPNRPTHRPNRPTTRPTPTRPNRPTTRPTPTRPNRPTTRPTPTRPNRPTTRPTPTRPNRPTTRPTPTRPNRPTTRPAPTRPNRPTTRPAPSRPNRGGGTTRPNRGNGGNRGSRPSTSGNGNGRRRPRN